MTDLEYKEDPDLSPAEKETTIRMANDQEVVHIASEQRSIIKWLDNHPDFSEETRRVKDGRLCAIFGTLPVGCLHLKGRPRQATNAASVLGTLEVDHD